MSVCDLTGSYPEYRINIIFSAGALEQMARTNQDRAASNHKMLFMIIMIASSMIVASISARGDNMTVTIRINASDISSGNVSENIFTLTNHDYQKTKSAFNITFSYNISRIDDGESLLEKTDTIRITNFKYRKSTGLGKFRFSMNSTYRICSMIVASSGQSTESITISCVNISSGSFSETRIPCALSPEIIVDDYSAVMSLDKLSFKVLPKKSQGNQTGKYVIEYWIEDTFGNVLKRKANTSSSSKKSFTLKDNAMMTLMIRAKIYNISCRNSANITESSVAIVVNPETTAREQIELLDIKQAGNMVFVKVSLFRNSSESEVRIWFEDRNEKISNIYTIDVLTMYSHSIFNIPIQISEERKGTSLVIEGFGKRIENMISLENRTRSMAMENAINLEESRKDNETGNHVNISSRREEKNMTTVEKDFFIRLIAANKTENVINSPNVNSTRGNPGQEHTDKVCFSR